MKTTKLFLLLQIFILSSCVAANTPPDNFHYQEIQTSTFKLASWQKISSNNAPYKIYIEGDGYAFNHRGKASHNPTPRGTTLRDIAFKDPSPNVIYLARPCQFVKNDPICSTRHWTTARFAPEVIRATSESVEKITKNQPIILIGFSGGAQVAGLVATTNPHLHIKKLITIAGNLDHQAWTNYHHLPPLNESLSLADYQESYLHFPQTHYVGEKDNVMPPQLIHDFVGTAHKQDVILVPQAEHNSGFMAIAPQIWQEQ